MAKKEPGLVADRPVISIRPPFDLKQKLEEAARKSGRSVGREAEQRLEASFVEAPVRIVDPIPGVFSDEVRRFLRNKKEVARLVEVIADTFMYITKISVERGRDEVEVRTAMRAAIALIEHFYLWRGKNELKMEGDPPKPGVRIPDMPPAAFGYNIALERMIWLNMFHESVVEVDTSDSRISNFYSGDGKTVVFGPSHEQSAARREEIKEMAAKKGDAVFDTDNLHKYRPSPMSYPRSPDADTEEYEGPPPQSLKDIMGR